jgi:3-oxoadipate enol-lactonase
MRCMLARRELDVRRITYFDVGTGAPLVLIHAFPLNAEMWLPQLDAAFAGWRLIAPDLRGFGPSGSLDASTVPASVEDHAEDILALLHRRGIEQAVIAGLSLGGYVAFALFRRAPHLFRGLVLADTRATADTDEGREGRRTMQALAEREGAEGIAREMLPKLLSERTRQTQPDVVGEVERLILSSSPDAIRAALGAMMKRPDSTPDLARLDCPALIVVGEDDRLTPIEDSRRMQGEISGSELAIIPGAGHLSNLEQPSAFNARLSSFLNQYL